MSINIYKGKFEHVDWICDDSWELPDQLYGLEEWLKTKGTLLPKDSYVADIGFSIQKNASGGGGILSSEAIKILHNIGMEVYFSEYSSPCFPMSVVYSIRSAFYRVKNRRRTRRNK